MAETIFRRVRTRPDKKVSRAAFWGQRSGRAVIGTIARRPSAARLLSVMKSEQLPLFGPADWEPECQSHQLLGGELWWVLAVDDGGDNVRRKQGQTQEPGDVTRSNALLAGNGVQGKGQCSESGAHGYHVRER